MIPALVHLDWWSVRPYRTQLLLLLGIAAAMGLMGEPAVVLLIVSIYAVLAAGYPFAVAEKNDLDTLLGMLPVARRDAVLARYLWAVGLFAVALVAGAVLTVVVASATGTGVTAGDVGLVAALGFTVFGFAVAVQYPVYLAMGYLRARVVAIVPMVVIAAAGIVLAPRVDLARLPSPAVAAPALVLGTALLLAVSAALAVRLDARRTR